MVRSHEVDLSLEQRFPQSVAIASVADRGRALERRAVPRELGCVERQVMGTGLDSHVGAHVASRPDCPECFDGRKVDDVNACTRLTRGGAGARDRSDLDERWPR